ncbi:MAG: hypothetical protein KatS3mg131_3193 [Candidatus Tectimicrobiota bacterium]|nr:MAG: hypothetical protein KatS3mg131_3193 [Candidatus Tectomicrobia bacterium]
MNNGTSLNGCRGLVLPQAKRTSRALPAWLALVKRAVVILVVALGLSALWALGVLKALELLEALFY